ncbi:DUF4097 family beta strand repeat-containing protein [Neobacillus sp. D3-1R]|uniref:DUF4097 family beta strand repeat-containing protein n=1 Tax=Neobacillus sp. D3-1R TaxID=3445778 RepID=UPI003F9FD038
MNKERERILKLVEEGKLSVQEALTLLEGLDKEKVTVEQEKQDSEITSKAKVEDHEKKDETYYKFQSTKEKIFDFVDTAFKKLKEIDIDLNIGKSIEMAHIFQQANAEFRDVDIHVANGSVQLIPWDQSDVRVECQAKIYRVESLEEARTTFLQGVIFNIENNRLNFQTHHKWMKVDAKVYIPFADYDKVRVRLYNGPISTEDMRVKDLKVDTANGKVSLENIQSQKVKAETANGKIKVKKSNIEEFEAETINGAIKYEGGLLRGNLHTFNGNISCTLTSPVCETLTMKATTGHIELAVPSEMAVSGELKSNLGNFDVKLDGIQVVEEKNEVVQKWLRFKPVAETDRVLHVQSDAKAGTIRIKPLETVK